MEVTKWLKPSISVSRIGDSASLQAATRVNVEQATKRKMCRPIRLPYRGRLKQLGELSETYAQLLHRGIGDGMHTRKFDLSAGVSHVCLIVRPCWRIEGWGGELSSISFLI